MTPAPPTDAVRLGILSDTHGRADACRLAVQTLLDMGAQALAHCGDVGDEAVLDELAGRPAWFVWGNNDLDRARLARYAQDLGLTCLGNLGRFQLAGKTFALTHGDDASAIAAIRAGVVAGTQDDYLLTGHTHVAHDRRDGQLRWINPGALYRAHPKTVALLDVSVDELVMRSLRL
jgi:putative phosphoesterase